MLCCTVSKPHWFQKRNTCFLSAAFACAVPRSCVREVHWTKTMLCEQNVCPSWLLATTYKTTSTETASSSALGLMEMPMGRQHDHCEFGDRLIAYWHRILVSAHHGRRFDLALLEILFIHRMQTSIVKKKKRPALVIWCRRKGTITRTKTRT